MIRKVFGAAIAAALVLVGCDPPDACETPDAWVTDFGSPEMCRYVREKQLAGCTLRECLKQDGATWCIVICPKGSG